MSAGSLVEGEDGTSEDPGVERVLALLTDALKIIDALELPPQIGARLQEVIGAIEENDRA